MNDSTGVEHINRIIEAMRREFEQPVEHIADQVRIEYERLASESRVAAFVPILTERRVRLSLRNEMRANPTH